MQLRRSLKLKLKPSTCAIETVTPIQAHPSTTKRMNWMMVAPSKFLNQGKYPPLAPLCHGWTHQEVILVCPCIVNCHHFGLDEEEDDESSVPVSPHKLWMKRMRMMTIHCWGQERTAAPVIRTMTWRKMMMRRRSARMVMQIHIHGLEGYNLIFLGRERATPSRQREGSMWKGLMITRPIKANHKGRHVGWKG